jgi:hypothetical protein
LTWALEELANFNKNNQLIVAACNEGLPATLLRCRAKNHLHLNKILTSAAGILRAYGRRIGRDAVLAGGKTRLFPPQVAADPPQPTQACGA